MGCYLAIYVPTTEDREFGCSYSTFNNIRVEMTIAAMKREGYENVDFELRDYEELIDKMTKYEYDGICTLLKHSDCDGSYSTEDARLIVEDYEKIKEYLVGSSLLNWIRAMIRTFDYASKMNAIVLIC